MFISFLPFTFCGEVGLGYFGVIVFFFFFWIAWHSESLLLWLWLAFSACIARDLLKKRKKEKILVVEEIGGVLHSVLFVIIIIIVIR